MKQNLMYCVIETCMDYFVPLGLDKSPSMPGKGVLVYVDDHATAALFSTRRAAQAAITRTMHYQKAFDLSADDGHVPNMQTCIVKPFYVPDPGKE